MNQGCEDGFEASRVRCRVARIDVCVGRPLGNWRKVSFKFLDTLRLERRKKEEGRRMDTSRSRAVMSSSGLET